MPTNIHSSVSKAVIKRIQRVWVALLSLTVGLSPTGHAAYLENGTDSVKGSDRSVAPLIRPIPEAETIWARLIQSVEVGKPVVHRDFQVFPLILRRDSTHQDIRTLDEALAHDWITLREHDAARVSGIRVRNDSKYAVFLMAGEMLSGGQQNRILQADVLLGPLAEFIDVPVYCIEKERWAGERTAFTSSKRLAEPSLRMKTGRVDAQESIWDEIDTQLKKARIQTPTRAYEQIYKDRKVDKELRTLAQAFKGVPQRQVVGAVMVSGHQIRGCELFADPDLFARLWPKIIRSYTLNDAICRDAKKTGIADAKVHEEAERYIPPIEISRIQQFLDYASRADLRAGDTPGQGRLYRVSGTAVSGSALIWRDEVIHAVLFKDEVQKWITD